MTAKRKKRRKSRLQRFLSHPVGKVLFTATVAIVTLGLITFSYFYFHFARLTDEKLAEGPIGRTAMLFADARRLTVGDQVTLDQVAGELRRAGYGESVDHRKGRFEISGASIEIHPGSDSYHSNEPVVVHLDGDRVAQIVSLRDNSDRPHYALEPELITNLFDRNREKRRLVRFADLPEHLVNAIVAAEDKRFFQHSGFDPVRVAKAAWITWIKRDRIEGASTLSMQLAGDIWLDRSERTYSRKAAEVLITMHLERKLTKQQIFEYYANQIYLGRVGTFDIHGYGQGAQAFFGKDVSELTLPEAAMLAGLPRAPSPYNPFRNPERAKTRRDWVLGQMLATEYLTEREYAVAAQTRIELHMGATEIGDAPYFVDLANRWLREQYRDHDFQASNYRVYTTMDMNLQREAVEAVRAGLVEIDDRLSKLGRTPEKGWPKVQVALVALDPRTGAVKALVGGRRYAASQLNRALAKRQPGSVFKPFVYAAALNTAVEGGPLVMTNQSEILDEPTTFWYDDKPYEPNNYKGKIYGLVTLRHALTKSLNIPTVKVAEMVGYDRVVEMARRSGLNMDILATPAVALGSYEVTPLEIAGAYSMFANMGEAVRPHFIRMIRDRDGKTIFQNHPESRPALDPRVAYLMVNLMEDVLRTGTGVRVRLMGFDKPAAGKTGTSHDGWFAGFSSELLCAVWVGYDDNRELKLEGAQSALPIWAEFMKRSHNYREYQHSKRFEAPDGIVSVDIDPESGRLASLGCGSDPVPEVYVAGTEPIEFCGGGRTQVAGWDLPGTSPMVASNARKRPDARSANATNPRQIMLPTPPEEKKPKKKGFFGRLLDIFR